MFIYLDIIHYQKVGDTKAPLLRVIETNRRVKNGYACIVEPNRRRVFSDLDFKKLLINNVSNSLLTCAQKLEDLFLSLEWKKLF